MKGIDVSEAGIAVAQAHTACDPEIHDRVTYECCSLEQFVTREDGAWQYDAVVASEVIEHVADLKSFVKDQCALVKVHGLVSMSVTSDHISLSPARWSCSVHYLKPHSPFLHCWYCSCGDCP